MFSSTDTGIQIINFFFFKFMPSIIQHRTSDQYILYQLDYFQNFKIYKKNYIAFIVNFHNGYLSEKFPRQFEFNFHEPLKRTRNMSFKSSSYVSVVLHSSVVCRKIPWFDMQDLCAQPG